MSFPEDFWWGGGASSDATEGAADASDRRDWEVRGRLAESGTGIGFASSFVDDLPLLADVGLGHLRYVLDWSRLEPEPGRHDTAAVEHARQVLEAARAAGVSVWACLHDGSLPGWFAVDEHGFGDARSRGYFWSRHVEFVGEGFGDLVHGWVPTFEPNRWAARGWLDGVRPPGRHDDGEGFTGALEGVLLASVDAALRLRQDGQPVATAHWLVPVFPARLAPDAPPTADAEVMAQKVDEVHRRSWLRLLAEETLVLPNRSPIEVPGAREAFDLIGFTYRHALAVRGDGALLPYPQALATGPDGQVAWAEGLALVLHQLADALPERPLLIAGVGAPVPADGDQEEYVREVLEVAEDAAAGGIDLRGLWWTGPIDGPGQPSGRALVRSDRSLRPAGDLLSRVAGGAPVPR
ncbi:family 1 glycosylhydrolase [Aquihabitans sp. McL0605]|uniref:family 1 glycosylhydrolase n=1 Tax=Aquihabitans sp. McL0605 TaxID=3415671 RepID=UPI003CECDDB2